MEIDKNHKKKALITGASSGIGLAFAKKLALEGYDLVLVARRKNRLEEIQKELESTYSVKVTVISADLTLPEERKKIYQSTLEKDMVFDLVINNAGMGYLAPFLSSNWESHQQMLDLNIMAVTEIAHTFLKPMVERKSGAMVIVASTAAYQILPFFATYGATKSYDYYLAIALYAELKREGVHVMALCPGPTLTEFGGDSMDIQKLAGPFVLTAHQVVHSCWKGLKKKKKEVIPGFWVSLVFFLFSLLPSSLQLWLNYRIFQRSYEKMREKSE